MKIFHYLLGLPPVRKGGLIIYVLDLAREQQKQGHDVALIVPGSFSKLQRRKVYRAANYEGLKVYKIKNPVPIPISNGIAEPNLFVENSEQADMEPFDEFLSQTRPDVLHIHSLLGLPPALVLSAKKWGSRLVYTTHDYYGICCNVSRMNVAGENCHNCDFSQCYRCHGNAFSLVRMKIEQSVAYAIFCRTRFSQKILNELMLLKARKQSNLGTIQEAVPAGSIKNIQEAYARLEAEYRSMLQSMDIMHYNSNLTRRTYEGVLGQTDGVVLPVMTGHIRDNRRSWDRVDSSSRMLHIGYLGNDSHAKGLDVLIDVLDHMDNVRLHTYGIDNYHDRDYIVHHNSYRQSELEQVYSQFDVLVVPSVWRETFSLITLEAISYAKPVLVSENVGARDVLEQLTTEATFTTPQELRQMLTELQCDANKLKTINEKMMRTETDIKLSYKEYAETLVKILYA